MKKINPAILYIMLLLCCGACKGRTANSAIAIAWQDSIAGDFSFAQQWNYPEGVYRNVYGQLSCDGLCPPETELMKDENGKIFQDSLASFYRLLDTTHRYQSLQSDTEAPEFMDAPYVQVKRIHKDTVEVISEINASTHSQLKIKIIKDQYVLPTVTLVSMLPTAKNSYPSLSAQLTIDEKLWKKGVLKAHFNFLFLDEENPNKPIAWKGKILSEIQ